MKEAVQVSIARFVCFSFTWCGGYEIQLRHLTGVCWLVKKRNESTGLRLSKPLSLLMLPCSSITMPFDKNSFSFSTVARELTE